MKEIIENLVTIANLGTLSALGVIYAIYIKSLRERIKLSQEKSDLIERELTTYKNKVLELEKKSPANIEKILNDRITIRESEINKLAEDKEKHAREIVLKNEELAQLKEKLNGLKKYKKRMSRIENSIDDDDIIIDLNEYGSGTYTAPLFKYSNVQQLLDDLYTLFLRHEHPAFTYLSTWKLIDTSTGRIINSSGENDTRRLSEAGIIAGIKYRVERCQ